MRKLVIYILLLWNQNMVPEIQKFAKFMNNLLITLNAWKSINFFVACDRAGQTLSNKLVNKCFWTLKKNYILYRDPSFTAWSSRHATRSEMNKSPNQARNSEVLIQNELHVAGIRLYLSFRVTSFDREQATEQEEYFRARNRILRTGY